MDAVESQPAAAGLTALAEHRWEDALELLQRADDEQSLGGRQLEALAEAAWFNAKADLGVEIKERAFRAYLDEANPDRAAVVAFDLAREYSFKRQMSIASGWAARGERALEGREESAAHGYLAFVRSNSLRAAGKPDQALEWATRAIELGRRFNDQDLQAMGLVTRGPILVGLGQTDEGFASIEEATIAAVNGELDPIVAGVVFCSMIAVCRDVTDYGRASEWTEAAKRWCERESVNGFPGVCRVHRAEIMALQGSLAQAETELATATREIAAYNATPPLADGLYALGEIRMRLGDFTGAEDALRQAHALGRSPHPALALIRLSEGNLKAAVQAIEAAVAEESGDLWRRARLLPAQVEINVANGDPATARTALAELETIAEIYRSAALHATTHAARAQVLHAEGDAEGACRESRSAIRHWQEVGAAHEIARSRIQLGEALLALGRLDAAQLEIGAARAEFERLGTLRDLAAADAAIQAQEERRAAPSTTRRAFMFTDIVGSTNLAEVMGVNAWEILLRWHDDALRALFARFGGEVSHSTGDGFMVAFENTGRAIDCGVAVQRALAEHRHSSGFAPTVRIGVHAAEAAQREAEYSGLGVHIAARIAALAEGGELLVSADTLQAAGAAYPTTNPRAVSLKGVSTPVDVVSIAW